jgi:hypothetical protein
MSEPYETSEIGGSPDGWLTPTAATIAGFTIAVLSLLTNGTWVMAMQMLIARNGAGSFEDIVMATGVVQGLLAGGALVLARRGLDSPSSTARNLGGATVVLGVLAIVFAVLTVAAGLIAAT